MPRSLLVAAGVAAAALALAAPAATSSDHATGPAPALDPIARRFLDALAAAGGKPLNEMPVADARAVLASLQSAPVAKPDADVAERTIDANGRPLALRIVRPKGVAGPLPALLYLHGGGWVLGDARTHDRLVRQLAVGAQAAVVFVDYTRTPEAAHPVLLEECYAAARWVAEQGASAGIDGSRLAVAGDSAGGCLAAALAQLAKERGGPRLAAQVLFYPVTDADFDTPSYRQFASGWFLTRDAMRWIWDLYAPDAKSRADRFVAPLRATPEQLRGLPPTLVITAECDVLRDEGEAYARKLVEAGVEVTATRWVGILHDFVMLDALAETAAARGAVEQACAMLRRAFATGARS